MQPMTVADLIKFLKNFPKDLPVAYKCYSEQCLLQSSDIKAMELCLHRPDGWVPSSRPDKQTQTYLVFPGN